MNTKMNIPAVALGTWSWGVGAVGGNEVFGNSLNEAQLKPVFVAGLKDGLNLWDTAAVYGMGASETILGDFVKEQPRKDVVVSTKFTPQIADGASPDPMGAMLASSLERFGTDYIDLYWIHNPADVEKWTPGLIPLLQSGRVKHVGVSNHNLEQIKRAESILATEGFGISAVQNHYSLLYRASEDAGILEYCREKGVAFFAYMVLEQGALSGKYDTRNPLPEGSQRAATYNPLLPKIEELITAMKKLGDEHAATVPQIAIAWAIAKGTVPLIGVTRPAHVEDAAKAAKVTLRPDQMAELERIAADAGVDTRGAWESPMAGGKPWYEK